MDFLAQLGISTTVTIGVAWVLTRMLASNFLKKGLQEHQAKLQETLEEKKADLKKANDVMLEEMKEKHEDEMADLQREHSRAVDEWKAKYKALHPEKIRACTRMAHLMGECVHAAGGIGWMLDEPIQENLSFAADKCIEFNKALMEERLYVGEEIHSKLIDFINPLSWSVYSLGLALDTPEACLRRIDHQHFLHNSPMAARAKEIPKDQRRRFLTDAILNCVKPLEETNTLMRQYLGIE